MSQNERDDSRQRYVYGKEALLKMQDAKILIVGVNSVASEIAKNLVLTGTAIGIAGSGNVKISDLSANAMLRQSDIGKPLADTIGAAVKTLNPSKKVQVEQISQNGEITNLNTYTCVVQTDSSLISPIKLNDMCKASNIPYQLSETHGLSGRLFNDFGNKFTVTDRDGERVDDLPASEVLLSITDDGPQLYIGTKEVIPYADGSLINITDVHYQAKINDKTDENLSNILCKLFNDKNYRVAEITASRCRIGFDSDEHKEFVKLCNEIHAKKGDVVYIRGGYLKQVKEPLEMNFKTLGECYANNDCKNNDDMCDWAKMGRDQLYNYIYGFLDKQDTSYITNLLSGQSIDDSANKFIADLKAHHKNIQDAQQVIDDKKDVIIYFLGTFKGEFPAVVSIIGGWGAQEALKAVSGKFTPIDQFYYYDCFEILQEQPSTTSDPQTPSGIQEELPYGLPRDMEPQNSRYDGIIQSVGATLLKRMQEQSIFIVGAGALGCELLKLSALLGIKKVTVTDMDSIEPSNLSRQFLFRDSDRGRLKSEVAAERTKDMNPEVTVNAMAQKICVDNPFPDSFWQSFTMIINALDNVETRRFMDQQCLLFNKPMLESGTMGQKASTQVVIPRLTQNYAAQADPSSHDAPACTIHNFPSTFTHCIVHSQSEFEGLFARCSEDLKMFFEQWNDFLQSLDQDPGSSTSRLVILAQLDQALGGDNKQAIPGYIPDESAQGGKHSLGERITLQQLKESVEKRREYVFRLGASQYRRYLEVLPARLLATNPVDSLTADGAPFWQGDKRPPKCLLLDLTSAECKHFITSFARLLLRTLGLYKSEEEIDEIINSNPKNDQLLQCAVNWAKNIGVIGKEEVQAVWDNIGNDKEATVAIVNKCTTVLKEYKEVFKPLPERFDKDEPSGAHVEAIGALANGRARCYGIPEKTSDEVRRVAGRVVPAMVTATAAVVGLVGVEYAKVCAGRKMMESYKQAFLNMALPLMQLGENAGSASLKTQNGKTITPWDFLELSGDPTIQDVIDAGKKEYDVTVDGIMAGAKCIFMEIMDGKEKVNQTISSILAGMGAPPVGTIAFAVTDEEETELPYLKISFTPK